jgi:hypothetical protein
VESANGDLMRWLAGDERSAAAYLGDGERWSKRKMEASATGSFIAGGERGSWQQAHTSTADVEAVRRQQR